MALIPTLYGKIVSIEPVEGVPRVVAIVTIEDARQTYPTKGLVGPQRVRVGSTDKLVVGKTCCFWANPAFDEGDMWDSEGHRMSDDL